MTPKRFLARLVAFAAKGKKIITNFGVKFPRDTQRFGGLFSMLELVVIPRLDNNRPYSLQKLPAVDCCYCNRIGREKNDINWLARKIRCFNH